MEMRCFRVGFQWKRNRLCWRANEKKMNKKQQTLAKIFSICESSGDYIFGNDLVREICQKFNFKNQFDVTKLDHKVKLPPSMQKGDRFVLHIGQGVHQFVKGIDKGYHALEPIEKDEIIDWEYKPSILNETDTSESNIVSLASNQGIIYDFLESSGQNHNLYNARKTNISHSFSIGGCRIDVDRVQLEIDQTIEFGGKVVVIEAKNGFHDDFYVPQLFYPHVYYSQLKGEKELPIEEINCCYMMRKHKTKKTPSVVRFYLYKFNNTEDMSSLQLLKKKQYNLIG